MIKHYSFLQEVLDVKAKKTIADILLHRPAKVKGQISNKLARRVFGRDNRELGKLARRRYYTDNKGSKLLYIPEL